MKTVGERIRQAREARGMSGDQLAKAVGYKHQSGIGNLEGRATGSGGKKIAAIAAALNVSTDWLPLMATQIPPSMATSNSPT